jgi:hypothetical protein
MQTVVSVQKISECLTTMLRSELFSIDVADEIYKQLNQAEQDLTAMRVRVIDELAYEARVFLSTIGSSHKLPTLSCDQDDKDNSHGFEKMPTSTNNNIKPTNAIFDEAGCIPCFKFLGLTRLGHSIEALVCVGDIHQLPPYDPGDFQPRWDT